MQCYSNTYYLATCEYFKQKVYNLLDKVQDMEHKYKLTDP